MITSPVGMNLQDWADQVILDLDSNGSFSKLTDDDWQGWGVQFLANQNLGSYNLANPYFFKTWPEWADSFYGELS